VRILVVEDDELLAMGLVDALEAESYAVDLAGDGARADELMATGEYDLVVLDWNVPPPSGLELLRSWRDHGYDLPVLMLTGRAGVEDRVSGLDTGADDYLTKPFALDELLARVRSLLRRRPRPLQPLEAGDLLMDRAARQITVDGEPVRLTPKEFGVLEYLLSRRDEVVSRQELTEHVWDHAFDPSSNTVDVIVYRVRKKIDGDREERLLHTVTGVGYRLSSERRSRDEPGAGSA
jgi:DNA-binding response OmpR family regulator